MIDKMRGTRTVNGTSSESLLSELKTNSINSNLEIGLINA
jgi:hypothetical protein